MNIAIIDKPDEIVCTLQFTMNPTPETLMCSACAGSGESLSGIPCICGGTGKQVDELHGFRVLTQQLTEQNKLLVESLKELEVFAKAFHSLSEVTQNKQGRALVKARALLKQLESENE